jgi:diacylglycerol kinase family enzyme
MSPGEAPIDATKEDRDLTINAQPRAPHMESRQPAESFAIVVNPDAGGEHNRLVETVAALLIARGRKVIVENAATPGDICRIAQATRADALLVAGGDGSINKALRGLLARPAPRPALGIIPQGTANVLRRELALPRESEALAEIFARGGTKPLHVGLANGQPFALMASGGVDAAVVEAVDLGLKKRIGRLALAVAAAKIFLRGEFPDIEAKTDEETLRAKWVVVTKSRFYGGPFVIDSAASVTKPGLTLVALTEISPRGTLALARYFLSGRLDDAGCVRKIAVTRVTLGGAGVAAQIDGDFLGRGPVEIYEAQEVLKVLA